MFAKRYRGIPSAVLSFNLLNEPCGFSTAQYVSVFSAAVKAIRAEDPDRFIMLDGNNTASTPVKEFVTVNGTGQAFRGYVPHAISHYGAWFVKPQPPHEPSWPPKPGEVNPKLRIWRMPATECDKFESLRASGYPVMIGEFGCYNRISHATALAWMEDCLKLWRDRNLGWALWNLDGPFGILDSERKDVVYEDFEGHKLDRKMLDLLRKYAQ